MDSQLLQVPRQPDKAVIQCFRQIAEKYEITNVSLNAVGYSNLGDINLTTNDSTEFSYIEKTNLTLINTLSMNIKGFNIKY